MFHRIVIPLAVDPTTDVTTGTARSLAQRLGAEIVELPIDTDDLGIRAVDVLTGAETEQADLIILPTGPGSGKDARDRAATLARLLCTAPAPVLVMSQPPTDVLFPEPLAPSTSLVIAPLDGTPAAERALPYAIALASQLDRVLLLAHVVPASLHMDDPERFAVWANADHEGRSYLRAVRQRVAAQSTVAVETMQLHGDVGQALSRLVQAHEGSILVFRAHDERGLDRVFHTNVTDDLLYRLPAPMLVVPSILQRASYDEELIVASRRRL